MNLLKYKTAKQMQKVIDNYFNTTKQEKWTITGLCLALKISRQQLEEYKQREEFAETINLARLVVENAYELDLRTKQVATGAIFALKNMGWKDNKDVSLANAEDKPFKLEEFIKKVGDKEEF